MKYRRFGQTNLRISVFSLGTMRCLADEATFEATVRKALDAGVNHIETARGYGQSEVWTGRSLRRWLTSLDTPRVVVTTKIPPTADAQTMVRHIQESLHRLELDYIDCVALHGLNTPEHLSWIMKPDGCMRALFDAQRAGTIRHIGFSSHGAQEVIRAALLTGYFEFVNLHYYFFFPHHQPIVELAAERDIGVFIISPADKGGMLYRPPERLAQLCAPYHPLELTYRWLLSNPRVTTLSMGPASPNELASPLGMAERTEPLSLQESEALQTLEQQVQARVGNHFCGQCYRCLPCPENIHIPEVLRLRNLAIAYEMTEFGQYRYGMFEQAGHWFPGRKANRCTECGDCLPRCPYELTIPELLNDAHGRLQGPSRRRLWG